MYSYSDFLSKQALLIFVVDTVLLVFDFDVLISSAITYLLSPGTVESLTTSKRGVRHFVHILTEQGGGTPE